MDTDQSNSVEGPRPDTPASPPEPAHERTVPAEAGLPPARRGRLWGAALALGLLAGAAAWLFGESRFGQVDPQITDASLMGYAVRSVTPETSRAAERTTVMRQLGVLGALLGLALGAAGGVARGSSRAAAVAGAIGLVLGGLCGVVAPAVVLPLFEPARAAGTPELIPSMLMHAGLWVPLAAAAGLALGLGTRGGWRAALLAALGAALGAVIGTVAYEFLGAVAFPLDETGQPISLSWPTRLMARLLVAVAAAAGATYAITGREAGARSPAPSDPAPAA